MQDFNPDQFLAETDGNGFDPDAFLHQTTSETHKPKENPDDLIPSLKAQGGNMVNMIKNAGSGLIDAVENPGQTVSDIGNSLAGVDAAGVYRAIRSIPVAGEAINNIAGSVNAIAGDVHGGIEQGKKDLQDYNNSIQQSDIQHQKEHPLTDFIQRSAGIMAMPASAVEMAAPITADAFMKSLDQGDDVITAMKHARNAAALLGTSMLAGKALSAIPGKFANKVGVSDEAMQAYQEAATPAAEEANALSAVKNQESPIPNFPTKDQLSYSLHDELPQVSESAPPLAPEAAPNLQTEPSNYFTEAGKHLGPVVGGILGEKMAGYPGAFIGGAAGRMVGQGIGKLVDQYGQSAVKVALDAGIQLDKIADTTYAGTIMKAALQGPKSAAVAHYMLSQTDPNYQSLTTNENK